MLGKLFNKKEVGAKLNNPITVSMPWGDETLTLETGRFAKQATASVMATMGQTMVLVSVVAESKAAEGFDYFPMSVDYQEKFAAAGKIPGSRNRREGQLSTDEILTSRLIDRPIRPLFPETFKNKLQITATCFSYDKKNSPDVIAMIGASAALAISGVPFMGPIGAVRVGYDNGEYVLNPAVKTINELEMDLVVAGTRDGVLMVESEIGELDEKITLGAIKFGFDAFQPVIKLIDELKEKAGKDAWEVATVSDEYKTIKRL
ncbi:MAG: hypothetical protein FWC83_01440 [Alphaproteobacteria bacterium]|nr:hypothetical protein [Alphaproteobacteria bacterium]